MGVSIDSSLYGLGSGFGLNSSMNTGSVSSSKADALSGSLSNLDSTKATDDELMDACRQFESYFVEQMLKGMEKTIMRAEENDNQYADMAKDMLMQEYASIMTSNADMGLARILYESMKTNTVNPVSGVPE